MKTLLIEVPDDVYERNVYYWAAARYFPAKAKEAVEVDADSEIIGNNEVDGKAVTLYCVREDNTI